MGMRMTLSKDMNHMHHDFVDAYWAIEGLSYDVGNTYFRLYAYPSRDARLNAGRSVDGHLDIGGPHLPVCEPFLYVWDGATSTVNIFPNGIPLDSNAQKTAVYNWIKSYTGLPFEDVLEE